jgi:hypothetical protein
LNIVPAGTALDGYRRSLSDLSADLHDTYNKDGQIDPMLWDGLDEAARIKASRIKASRIKASRIKASRIKASQVEIIPGKGSGQLKKRVLRFLDQKEVRPLYHRVEKDSDNFGRIFVYFRWK